MKGLPRSLGNVPESQSKTIIRKDFPISGSLDITGVDASVDAGTFQFGTLPEGNILWLGAVAYVQVDATGDTHVIDNWAGDYGIGTAANTDVDLNDAGDANLIPSTALTAGASDKIAPYTRGATTATEQIIIDNTDNSGGLHLNLLIDDNVITDTEDGTFVVTGTLHCAFIVLGDD